MKGEVYGKRELSDATGMRNSSGKFKEKSSKRKKKLKNINVTAKKN